MKNNYLVPIAIVIAGVMVGGALYMSKSNGEQNAPKGKQKNAAAESPSALNPVSQADHILGNPDAPVTLINFGDFRCRFCAMFQKNIKPIIMEKYVKTGKVRYVYRDLITMGENSILAAEAANCADEQGKYWEYADSLHGPKNGPGTMYTVESLSKIAGSLGLETSSFEQCLSSGKYKEEIKRNTENGRAAGATGTPTVFINGRIIVGVDLLNVYESMIEEELAKQ